MRRLLALLLALAAVAAPVAHGCGRLLPSITWFYQAGRMLGSPEGRQIENWGPAIALNWVVGLACSAAALWLAWRVWGKRELKLDPTTRRRLQRFRSIRRGWVSLWIVGGLVGFACLDMLVVGKRALAVQHEGHWYFPAFQRGQIAASTFGAGGDEEADYRLLREEIRSGRREGFVLLPLIPWNSTYDTDVQLNRPLRRGDDGLFRLVGRSEPYDGVMTAYADDHFKLRTREVRVRAGRMEGVERRFDDQGEVLGFVTWVHGEATATGPGIDPAAVPAENFQQTKYNPLPPSWQRRHYLGTNSGGWDVAAQLYGGLQVLLRGLVPFLLVTYALGIALGTAMGYFAGWFDLVSQRLIEILSSVPLLLIIIILSSQIGKEKMTIPVLVGLFCCFSWIGIATYLRSMTYKEKTRDYVSAARSLGAGTGRILGTHILPNVLAVLITLVPFEIVGFSAFLTSLDFIGFGLQDSYPSWGRLLADGTRNLASPWIVSSVFVLLVVVLLLFTFIGEALREAYDPKKLSTYR